MGIGYSEGWIGWEGFLKGCCSNLGRVVRVWNKVGRGRGEIWRNIWGFGEWWEIYKMIFEVVGVMGEINSLGSFLV